MRTFILVVLGIIAVSFVCDAAPYIFNVNAGGWWDLISILAVWLALVAVGLSVMIAFAATIGITIFWIFFSALFSFWPIVLIVGAIYMMNRKEAKRS